MHWAGLTLCMYIYRLAIMLYLWKHQYDIILICYIFCNIVLQYNLNMLSYSISKCVSIHVGVDI